MYIGCICVQATFTIAQALIILTVQKIEIPIQMYIAGPTNPRLYAPYPHSSPAHQFATSRSPLRHNCDSYDDVSPADNKWLRGSIRLNLESTYGTEKSEGSDQGDSHASGISHIELGKARPGTLAARGRSQAGHIYSRPSELALVPGLLELTQQANAQLDQANSELQDKIDLQRRENSILMRHLQDKGLNQQVLQAGNYASLCKAVQRRYTEEFELELLAMDTAYYQFERAHRCRFPLKN